MIAETGHYALILALGVAFVQAVLPIAGARLRDPKDGADSIRLYFNPLVQLIWLGALVMFFGGAVSMSDRRLRVGAPKRAQNKTAPVTAGE